MEVLATKVQTQILFTKKNIFIFFFKTLVFKKIKEYNPFEIFKARNLEVI